MGDKSAKTLRLYELEIIRTVSFLAVVLQHVLGAYSRRQNVEHWQNIVIGVVFVLCKFAVPAFLFVSGIVLFKKYYGKLKYVEFLKKRLSSIVLPYLIWSVFYFFYQWHVYEEMPVKGEFLKNVLVGDVSYHTWYVILILQFYVFLPIVFWWFKRIKSLLRGKVSAAAVLLLGAVVYCIMLACSPMIKDVPVIGTLFYKYQSRNFIFYLIYFMLGGVCALYPNKFKNALNCLKWWIFAGFALSYGAVTIWTFNNHYLEGAINLNAVGSMDIMVFVLTSGSIMLIYTISLKLSKCPAVRSICSWIGKHSYTAYLAHAMVIGKISLLLLEHFPDMSYPAFYGILIPLSVLISLVVAWIFDFAYNSVKRITYRGKTI